MLQAGTHIIADLYGVDVRVLRDEARVMILLERALREAGFHVLNSLSCAFQTGGEGVTGLFLLSESHLAFHGYPEHGYVAIDVFSCGSADPKVVVAALHDALQADGFGQVEIDRGRLGRGATVKESAGRASNQSPAVANPTLHDRYFVGVQNYDDGDFTTDTLFHYRQKGDQVWGTYQGGGVAFGTLVGVVDSTGRLGMRWQYVRTEGGFVSGSCESVLEWLPDGALRLVEAWRTDDGEQGTSIVEEVAGPRLRNQAASPLQNR